MGRVGRLEIGRLLGRTTGNRSVLGSDHSDCAFDEACTQGGHCVNITGERDASAPLQADLDALNSASGLAVPYRLPDNAILQLNDMGEGYGLRIETPVIFDGAGSRIEISYDTNGILAHTMIRDLRLNAEGSVANESIGVDVRAHGVRLQNMLFWSLGTGVRAYSELNGESVELNNQQWSNLVFQEMHYYAMDLRGQVNHGAFTGLEVIDSAGIYDASDLGNTYVATTMEGTHGRSLTLTSENSHHTVLAAMSKREIPIPRVSRSAI